MRRLLRTLLLTLLLTASTASLAQANLPFTGQGLLLMNVDTGQVLYSEQADERFYPASTTKVLTALVVLEQAELTDRVVISETAVHPPPDSSLAYLVPGETLTVEQLLYGLLLASGNDAAIALAEHVSGSEEAFVELMNERARELGATRSHFVNAHGFHDPDHYTTPRDLALIFRAALQNPDFVRISGTIGPYAVPGHPDGPREYLNHNQLLGDYPGAYAGKTGYTEEAGRSLVAAAKRGEQNLLGVVLKSDFDNVYIDMAQLFSLGFEQFKESRLVAVGEPFGPVAVVSGEIQQIDTVTAAEFKLSQPRLGPTQPIERLVHLPDEVKAPIAEGQKLGYLELIDSSTGETLATIDLVANQAVAYRPTFSERVAGVVEEVTPLATQVGLWALRLAALVGVWLLYRLIATQIRRRRRRRRARQSRPLPREVYRSRF